MNKKLLLMMILASCLMSSNAFADQDYHARNVFNRLTDWTATLGKNAEDKQRIIDQRVEMRAKQREARDQKNREDAKRDQQYNAHMNDLNISDAKAKVENDRKAAIDAWQIKADAAKTDLNNDRDDVKRKIESQKDEENKNYDKHVADLKEQYKDNADTRNEKIKDAENDHTAKINDLSNQWKAKEDSYTAKEQELNTRLNKDKSDIDHNYDMKKEEIK